MVIVVFFTNIAIPRFIPSSNHEFHLYKKRPPDWWALKTILFNLPGGMFEISSDPSHPGTLFVGIAEPVPVIYDMDLVRWLFSQTFRTRTIGMSGCHGFRCPDTQRFCKFLKLVFRMKSFAHICQPSKTDKHFTIPTVSWSRNAYGPIAPGYRRPAIWPKKASPEPT